jgi:hypothetical protein
MASNERATATYGADTFYCTCAPLAATGCRDTLPLLTPCTTTTAALTLTLTLTITIIITITITIIVTIAGIGTFTSTSTSTSGSSCGCPNSCPLNQHDLTNHQLGTIPKQHILHTPRLSCPCTPPECNVHRTRPIKQTQAKAISDPSLVDQPEVAGHFCH